MWVLLLKNPKPDARSDPIGAAFLVFRSEGTGTRNQVVLCWKLNVRRVDRIKIVCGGGITQSACDPGGSGLRQAGFHGGRADVVLEVGLYLVQVHVHCAALWESLSATGEILPYKPRFAGMIQAVNLVFTRGNIVFLIAVRRKNLGF